MLRKSLRAVVAAVAVIAIAAAFAYQYGLIPPRGDGSATRGSARIGGPFTLVDQDGARRSDTDFRGRLMLIFFGYTHCPDVCPTALQDIGRAMARLGDGAAAVQPIMITIDPDRDTPARLRSYLANFDKRLIGLTGTQEAIARAARGYGVYHARSRPRGATREGAKPGGARQADGHDDGDYLMDHGATIYLMGRDGRYLTHFTPATGAEAMAAAIAKHL